MADADRDALMEAWLAGEVDAEQCAELRRSVAGNATAQANLLAALLMEARLRQVLGRPRPRQRLRRPWLPLAAAALILLALGAWTWTRGGTAQGARILAIDLPDGAAAPIADAQPLHPGQPLPPGLSLASQGARITMGWPDGSQAVLAPGAHVLLPTEAALRLRLEGGEAVFQVAAQGPGGIFDIASPHGEAAVRGTRFALRVDAGSSRVEVQEGRVLLRSGSAEALLAADETARFGDGRVDSPRSARALRSAFASLRCADISAQEGLVVIRDDPEHTVLGYLEPGDWARWDGLDFGDGATALELTVVIPWGTGRGERQLIWRLDGPEGPLLAEQIIRADGEPGSLTVRQTVAACRGVHDLYVEIGRGNPSGVGGLVLGLDRLVLLPHP